VLFTKDNSFGMQRIEGLWKMWWPFRSSLTTVQPYRKKDTAWIYRALILSLTTNSIKSALIYTNCAKYVGIKDKQKN
jgi:hypothetical protein